MSLTEEQRKQNMRFFAIYMGVIIGIVCAYLFGYVGSVIGEDGQNTVDAIMATFSRLSEMEITFEPNAQSFVGMFLGVCVGGISYFLLQNDNERNYAYADNATAGTAGFMTQKDIKEYNEKFITADPPALESSACSEDLEEEKKKYSQNIIHSNKFYRPLNSRAIIGNNNTLIVGGAGTGKSRFYIKPNVLQMNSSYIITDPSGEMIAALGNTLRAHGYKIKVFNISDMTHSNCYNPIRYVRDEAGVNMVIDCLITNTTKGGGGGDNQFFVDAEKLLYSACIYYLIDYCHDDSRKNFSSIMNMINSSSVDEKNPDAKSPLDLLFDKCPKNSLAFKYYKAFKQAAGKTLKSIIISCVTRLQPFMTPQVVNLTKTDTLDLEKIGDEKTALFIITPQADRTYSFLASMLYSQLFETLYHKGETQKASGGSEQMNIPVRCLMDEFANIGEIPEFPSKLSTMRKYNISASIVLQDIAQIEAMYKDNWKTLVGNCSTILFLGTQEPNTLKYFSDMLGKTTIKTRSRGVSKGGKGGSNRNYQNTGRELMTPDELGRMPSDECIVFTQNMRPVMDKKYLYQNHPYYSQTGDANPELSFLYQEMSVYNNASKQYVDSIIKAQAEINRFELEKEEAKHKEEEEIHKEQTFDADAEINKYSLSEDVEKNFFERCLQTCQFQAAANFGNPICMFRMNDVPSKYLYSLAQQTSSLLSKKPLFIFSNTIPKENRMLIGIGVDDDEHTVLHLLEKSNLLEGLQNNEEDGYVALIVSKDNYDALQQELNEHVSIADNNSDSDAKSTTPTCG